MDLFECRSCERRFLVPSRGSPPGDDCPFCGASLDLKVRSIPGARDEIARALHAHLLDPEAADPGQARSEAGD